MKPGAWLYDKLTVLLEQEIRNLFKWEKGWKELGIHQFGIIHHD